MPETTDPTFYRTPGEAIAAPPEQLAYVAAFDPAGQTKDAITTIDTDPSSPDYGQVVGWSELPTAGNELHHFGWNACSSALCHQGHGDHGQPLERRYLIVPGIRSSRTYVLDTKPDPATPRSSGRSPPRSWPPRPATPAPHRPLRPRWHLRVQPGRGQRQRRPRGGSPCSTTTPSTSSDRGSWTAATSTSATTAGGTSTTTPSSPPSGHAVDDRERPGPRRPARPPLRPPPELLEHERASPHPAHRPGRRPPDGAGGAPGPRPEQDVGLCRGGHQRRGPVRVGVAVVPGRRPLGPRKVVTIPAEPADPATLPPALQPFGAVPP